MATHLDETRVVVMDDDDEDREIERLAAERSRADLDGPLEDNEPELIALFEISEADLSAEDSMGFVPRRLDEFTCSRCFIVHHRRRMSANGGGPSVCNECT